MRLLLCFLAICLASAQQTAVFVPFLWTSPMVTSISAYSINYYHAPLCGIAQYDNKILNLQVNCPYIPWSNGSALYISVYNNSNFSGNPLITNKDNSTGLPIQELSFKYSLEWGDLWISAATTTLFSDLTYTISIIVTETFEERAVVSESWLTEARTKHAAKIAFGYKPDAPQKRSLPNLPPTEQEDTSSNPSAPVVTDLLQLLYSPTTFVVPTSTLVPFLIDFTYCPTQNSYTLDVTIVAVDQHSAFSTYICTNFSASQPCSPVTGKDHSDPKGAALNDVSLPTVSREFTALEVAVYGVGNYGSVNRFLFSVDVM